MPIISDKLRCPSDTNTKQWMSYLTSYDVLQTLTQIIVCHIGQATLYFRHQHRTMHIISDKLRCPSDTSTEQCMSYLTSYDVLQLLAQNNACHIGEAKMSFRHKHSTMHVISDKLRCPSDTNTEQCISYRKSYDVLQTAALKSACHIGKATMTFIHYHRTMHVIWDKLRYLSDTNTEQCLTYRKS
jgi:hypothetical protein